MTWGVFTGQEIVQSTIIERESFLTWKVRRAPPRAPPLCVCVCARAHLTRPQDEAFSIWNDWASLFEPGSEERALLEDIRNTRWLVNVTHHDFKDPDALWRFLLEDASEAGAA